MAVTLTVYAGSSLLPRDTRQLCGTADSLGIDLAVRPPIIRGDLLRTPVEGKWNNRALILDGEFGQNLSVSVTEIREYLGRGLYLAGASSMGALRAVECRTLGMIQHGWVCEQYLAGHVEADAEVSLLMDPVTSEALTVPLINVRWLLQHLVERGELDTATAATALEAARRVNYRARIPEALANAFRRALPADASDLLARQLEPDTIPDWDRKRLDGIEAVEAELHALARFPAHT
ncbi:TfuA-like protein [Kitasatospora sp. NPDC091257]|uniref:TfuA-like protein n=1 Tax=Kitasatospora sp. NPDC091257 TaxID=3364084 RepID=UPI0037FB4D02